MKERIWDGRRRSCRTRTRSWQRHGGCCALAGVLDHVEHDVVLLKLLSSCEADQRALRVRRAEKDYHALPKVVVLGVFECELCDRRRN